MRPFAHSERQVLFLVGIGTQHSVAPPMHNYIAKQLDLPWTFHAKEFASLERCVHHLQSPNCSGGAVTMPWKSAILSRLDEIDESASTLAACNTVASDTDGRLTGSNVDWRGVAGALQEGGHPDSADQVGVRRGLVIGAGGAARAAVYALWRELGCEEIYILNRDDQEVADLMRDVQRCYTTTATVVSQSSTSMTSPPLLVHVKTADQAAAIKTPNYAVGTVPDLEPKTAEEQQIKALLAQILEGPQKGVLLDMCYKPPRTRHIAIAAEAGWRPVEGWRVIGHQARYQWRAWAGEKRTRGMEKFADGMWKVLRDTVSQSPAMKL